MKAATVSGLESHNVVQQLYSLDVQVLHHVLPLPRFQRVLVYQSDLVVLLDLGDLVDPKSSGMSIMITYLKKWLYYKLATNNLLSLPVDQQVLLHLVHQVHPTELPHVQAMKNSW